MNIYALELARLPNTTLKILLRLAKTLLRDKPIQTNAIIDEALDELAGLVARVDKALILRLVETNPEIFATEMDFDRAVDGLWILIRRYLEQRTAYAHAGFDALSPALAEQGGLAERREEARKAYRLWARLFGAEGTAFTKSRFINQGESMAALLGMIASEQLRAELVEVIGEGPVRLVEACQVQYETMVSDRLARKRGSGDNLNELRHELRWALVAYIQAVHSLYRPKQPETAELVLDALRPVLTLREELARMTSSSGASEPLLEDFVELEELDAEDELDALEPEDEAELENDL